MRMKVLKNSIPYILIMGIAIFIFRGIFVPGFMSGYDNSFHYYDAHFLIKTLIPQYHWISGWSMQGLAGFPVFVDYYQTGFLFMALLNKALFVPLNFSYKLTVLLSYIILGAGFYKLTSYRFGKIPALFMAVCLMLQKNVYLDGILAGMWSNYLALGLFFIFFHFLDKNFKSMTIRQALALGLLLGTIILTHLYVALFAFLLFLIYMLLYAIEKVREKGNVFKKCPIYSCMPIVAFTMSSYYLYGFIVAKDYFRKLGQEPLSQGLMWGLKSFFGPLETMDTISNVMINIPILARIIFSLLGLCHMVIFLKRAQSENRDIRRFLIANLCFIAVAGTLFTNIFARFSWWSKIPLIPTLQFSRLLIYIQTGFYLFAAYGIAKFLGIFKKKQIMITVCMIPIALSVFFHERDVAREATRMLEQSPKMADVHRVWGWVNENIPQGRERIVYQNTVSNVEDPILNRSDVFALSGVFTKIPQIGASRSASPFPQEEYMRNDRGDIFGKPSREADSFYVKTMMQHFNAGHIVTVEPGLKRMLGRSELFSKEATFGIFNIFKLKEFQNNWVDFTKKAGYETLKFDSQHVTFLIRNDSGGNAMRTKVAYHPFWRAYLNSRQIEIRQDEHSLMQVSLPDKGFYRLDLVFNSFNPLLTAVSVLGVLAALAIIIRKSE